MQTLSAPVRNGRGAAATAPPPLRIGLVNNMPDAAVAQSERQFRRLLLAAAGERGLELHLFHLDAVERTPAMRTRMQARYRPAAAIADAGLDALAVTGACPPPGPLRSTALWPAFAGLVDQARLLNLPTLWSCLAAHAAVDRLDGVERRPAARKHSGVFACTGAHPWAEALADGWSTPHSRLNDLAEADLVAHGYQILGRSAEVGVDSFMRPGPAPFLFWQGHPEYDADTLALEYLRDLRQRLQGLRAAPPALPSGLFDAEGEAAWIRWTEAALAAGDTVAAGPVPPMPAAATAESWRASGVALAAAWLRASVPAWDR